MKTKGSCWWGGGHQKAECKQVVQVGLCYILLGEGLIVVQVLRPLARTSWDYHGRCLDTTLMEPNWNYILLLGKEAIPLWSWLFFCLLFDTFPVISVQKLDIPEKMNLERSGTFFSLTCCLQLLLPQPQIVTISLKTARKQSQKSLVVFDVVKSLMFFPCSDTASFISSAANSTLAT